MSKSLEEIIKEKDEIIFKLTKENLKLKEEILNKVLENLDEMEVKIKQMKEILGE